MSQMNLNSVSQKFPKKTGLWPITGLALLILVLSSLSCNFAARAVGWYTPTPTLTATPLATATPLPSPTAAPTLTPVPTLTPSPTPLIDGLYIPPVCQGEPVATVLPELLQLPPTPEPAKDPELSTTMQLRVFDDVTEKISSVYLYPDFNGVDWPGLAKAARDRIQAGMSTSEFYDEMYALINALNDEHSQFQSPSMATMMDEELSGRTDFVGIGVLTEPLIEKDRVAILSIFRDSPAEHAGLQVHDSILAADGLPVVEDGESRLWRVRGPQCSAVVLTVQSPGEEPRQVMLIRNRIVTGPPVEARVVKTTDGSRIGYLFLPSFFDLTLPEQVRDAMRNFGKLDGLIIDNRYNTGGGSEVVRPIISLFASGKLGSYDTRDTSRPFEVRADPFMNYQKLPMVVLVGEGTVSFGEIFAGILQNTGRAKIAGQTTLGNVEVLLEYGFEDGSRIWIASERFKPPVSDADWEKTGIIPDLEAFADWDTFTFETDPGIAAALTLLNHR
jgi:carboxyl-terminal processing protease